MNLVPKRTLVILLSLMTALPAYAQVCKEPNSNSSSNGSSSGSSSGGSSGGGFGGLGGLGGGLGGLGGGLGGLGGSSNNNNSNNNINFINCDMKQRDTVVTCDDTDNPGTRSSCPPKPMPMIETPKSSLIGGYSPYLYSYAFDNKEPGKAYSGTYAVGTTGGPDKQYNILGNSAGIPRALAACVDQIRTPKTPTSVEGRAKYIRLQLDNCANQYILRSAIYPFQKESSRLINNPEISSDPISLKTECQPLRMFPEMENEYSVTHYLRGAWMKMLYDPNFDMQKNGLDLPEALEMVLDLIGVDLGALGVPIPILHDPHYPKHTRIQSNNPDLRIPPPNPFPEVYLSQIASIPYEEILDPTHPFSPRWDYRWNERDFYSPMTTLYMADTKSAVYCAGVREKSNNSSGSGGLGGIGSIGSIGGGSSTPGGGSGGSGSSGMGSGSGSGTGGLGDIGGSLGSLGGGLFGSGGSVGENDDQVKVDVLEFRRKKFEDGIYRRIFYNTLCYFDQSGDEKGEFESQMMNPMNYCVKLNYINYILCKTYNINCNRTGERFDCFKCFKLEVGQKLQADERPPCSTHYDTGDLKVRGWKGIFPVFPALRNGFDRNASCNPLPLWFRKKEHRIDTICSDLRRPYTQINKLKMRYHKQGDDDNNVLKDGVPEGYKFKDYFGNHMPYPRLWDTGVPLLYTPMQVGNWQPPLDVAGQYTTIVGVGRETAAKSAGGDQDKHPDERCKLGGWGGPNIGGVDVGVYQSLNNDLGIEDVALPHPTTSWTELKMYQMRTQRLANISCLARYEKVFKTGSTENVALAALGGEWSRLIVQKCKKDGSAPCTFMTFKEYSQQGNVNTSTDSYTIPQTKLEGWPLSWRGYMSTGTVTYAGGTSIPLSAVQFPNFGNSGGLLGNTASVAGSVAGTLIQTTGLGSAQLGDIVLMPRGSSDSGDKPGLAKVGLVSEVNLPKSNKQPGEKDCTDRNDCYVQVMEADNGKWPDTCGTTDAFGELKTRYLYKPGSLPPTVKNELQNVLGWTTSCEDTKLSRCEYKLWNKVKIYRPRFDIRVGCTQGDAKQCGSN